MSANTIIDQAPLGALIRYTDGSPKPPARFTKKLAAWEPLVPSPPMKSTVTRFRCLLRSTRGRKAHGR